MIRKKVDALITAAVWTGTIISALLAIATRWPGMLNASYLTITSAWVLTTILLSLAMKRMFGERGVEFGLKVSAFFLVLGGTFWYLTQNGLDYGPGTNAILLIFPAIALFGIGERYRPADKIS